MVSVRAATESDRMDVARVHVRSWRVGYQGLISSDVLMQMSPEDRAEHYTFGVDESLPRTIVALEDEAIVGFLTFGASMNLDVPQEGEVFALFVDPDVWGRGVGHALMSNARERLRAMSFTNGVLWVLVGNERGMRFYTADGWLPDGLRREEVLWGVNVREVRLTRPLAE